MSSDAPIAAVAAETVLCVDDEPNILSALRRTLRPDGLRILVANSGAEALQIMAAEPVDLILSDMRMPEMDGARLLEQVHQRWPEVVRLLLTGHADMDATIAAINRGRIYRYLSKPWDDGELRATVRQGLDLRGLEREKQRLEALTQRQNEELVAVNASLEQRVAERTASLQQAHDRLKQNQLTTIRVFSSLIELRSKKLAGHGRRVADIARRLAEGMGCNEAEQQQIFVAGLLLDIGFIGMPDGMLEKPASKLRENDLAAYRRHSEIGEQALMPLDDMQPIAALIRSHHERHDGTGFPDRLVGAAIALGARILAVADTYDSLQSGLVTEVALSAAEAQTLMRAGRGTQFDPETLEIFFFVNQPQAPVEPPSVKLNSEQLEPEMVLAKDLVSASGVMMLSAGHTLTASLIDRIRGFERREGNALVFYVVPRSQ